MSTQWELGYSQSEAEPNKPDHIVVLKKNQSIRSDYFEVLIVVRG